MTKLNCDVIHCSSNRDGCCCRPSIKVAGTTACTCNETCCDSFSKIEQSASNSMDYSQPNPVSDISCSVKNCIHYKNNKCYAETINVSGTNACCKKETECNTFRNR